MNSHGVKVWLVHRADNSAILVVPPVKVRMEAQHSIFTSLRDLLWENFTFTLTSSVSSLLIIYKYEDKEHIIYTHTVLRRTHKAYFSVAQTPSSRHTVFSVQY